ncbi:MAG: hypothetical protein KDD46_05280 [Bdellovibrionales bacterium]|nr:hypothetical protein [Bdellovibrionales bacterium]
MKNLLLFLSVILLSMSLYAKDKEWHKDQKKDEVETSDVEEEADINYVINFINGQDQKTVQISPNLPKNATVILNGQVATYNGVNEQGLAEFSVQGRSVSYPMVPSLALP